MRKLEKLFVLAVLFAAAVVLAISLNRGGDEVKASDPLQGAGGVVGAADPLPSTTNGDPEHATEAPSTLLLSAGAETTPDSPLLDDAFDALTAPPAATALEAEPKIDPTARILNDTTGLRPSFMQDYMVYTVVAGDTWSTLAQRFFQDGRFTRNLHLANEDVSDLVPGSDILVPVYDYVAVDAGLQGGAAASFAFEPTAAPATTADVPPSDAPAKTPIKPAPAASGKTVEYVVQSGDTLSDISLAVFGTATRWNELLEVNRDRLTKPEALRAGMKLRIPEGGKLPAAGSTTKVASSKKTEAKPAAKTAEKAADKATEKKKKVL